MPSTGETITPPLFTVYQTRPGGTRQDVLIDSGGASLSGTAGRLPQELLVVLSPVGRLSDSAERHGTRPTAGRV